ncbi:MAG: MFS transporter [Acidobacteria bacterium]|nr:MAG: MFS transporter [Acidobacteriota bacterium]
MHQTKVDQSAYAPPSVGAAVQASAGGNYRWGICALLFFATTINYMDRQVLGLLAPDLQKIFRWNEIQYGYIVTTFQTTYALGLLLMGRFMGRLGTRLGYAISICIWSLAAMGHALANSAFGFAVARGFLGLGESGNFPAAIKTVTEWFPKKERALATGIFNSGTNVGAIVAPLTVPWIAVNLGWRWAFLFTGFFSATWLLLWLVLYRRPQEHSRISASELQYILSEPVEPTTQIAWAHLLRHRQTWAFAIGKFMTDPLCVVAVVFLHHLTGLWPQVALFSLATAAHQGWSANIFTTASDMFPRRAIGSVVGIGGFGGAVGGMCIASFTGYHLQYTHSYSLLMLIAGSAYLSALLVIHLLVPGLEPAVIEAEAK